jgi:hypothetical protein
LEKNPRSQPTSTGVFQFPADAITDEDTALTWWEQEFAPACEAVGALVNGALIVRQIVASLRRVRETALAESASPSVLVRSRLPPTLKLQSAKPREQN